MSNRQSYNPTQDNIIDILQIFTEEDDKLLVLVRTGPPLEGHATRWVDRTHPLQRDDLWVKDTEVSNE